MKGIVLEQSCGKCVILKEDGTFAYVRDKGYQVGQQIRLQRKVMVAGMLSAAACIGLLCAAMWNWFCPVSYVYMDINPSVRMEVNGFGQVLTVVPLNADAQNLLQLQSLEKNSVEECMEQMVQLCREEGYITQERAEVEVHVYAGYPWLEETVQRAAEELDNEEITVSVYGMSRGDNKQALKDGVSARRLGAIDRYTHCFGGTRQENTEKLKDVPTSQILKEIREYQLSQGATQEEYDQVYYVSERRKQAIEDYTDCFGGEQEENLQKLRGLSTWEIYKMIYDVTGKP